MVIKTHIIIYIHIFTLYTNIFIYHSLFLFQLPEKGTYMCSHPTPTPSPSHIISPFLLTTTTQLSLQTPHPLLQPHNHPHYHLRLDLYIQYLNKQKAEFLFTYLSIRIAFYDTKSYMSTPTAF